MRLIYVWLIVPILLYSDTLLIMNSNAKVERYASMEKAFTKHINNIHRIDISKMSSSQIKEYLYANYPDIIYTIGTKAYQYAVKYVPEKKIFFSSIVNYKRFNMGNKRFGVANELHTGMKVTLIKSLLNHTKTIGFLYSRYTKDIYESFKEEAKYVGMEVIGQKIDKDTIFDIQKLKNADIFVMIADPIMLKDEKKVQNLYKVLKEDNKPVVAYHPLYLKYGAVLILSVDIPTVGRQVAAMVHAEMSGTLTSPIQMPIGSKVIFNEGLAKRMKLHYDKAALSVVNKVIK